MRCICNIHVANVRTVTSSRRSELDYYLLCIKLIYIGFFSYLLIFCSRNWTRIQDSYTQQIHEARNILKRSCTGQQEMDLDMDRITKSGPSSRGTSHLDGTHSFDLYKRTFLVCELSRSRSRALTTETPYYKRPQVAPLLLNTHHHLSV